MPTRAARRRPRLLAAAALAGLVLPLAPAPAAASAAVVYVVTFAGPPSATDVEVLRGIAQGVHPYVHLPAAAVTLPPTLVPLLRNLPGVTGVWTNERYALIENASNATIKADQAWGATTGGLGWTGTGWTGKGIGIAVIDAGVDGTHPDLCGLPELCKGTPVKTVQNVKFVGNTDKADPVVPVENVVNTDTTSGHGSHVAGIAAGYGTASATPGLYQGVAPGAHLVGLGAGEGIEVVNVLAGFDYVLANKDRYNIKAVNNSWGPGNGTPYDPDHPVNRAITATWNAGISVVFGAGNDGPRTDSLNAFSVHPHSISVAATRKDGAHAFFSSRGVPGSPFWHPTVGAPGENIVSVRNATGLVTHAADATSANPYPIAPEDLPYYGNSSGTSMASPHVAGVVALMQQASYGSRGVYLTPRQVKDILQNTAVSGGMFGLPKYQHWEAGAGLVDALAATRAAAAGHAPAYDDGTTYDVRGYAGTVGPAAIVATSQFSSTYTVLPGAVSLEVTADWTVQGNDVDITVTAPDGTTTGTQLRCDPNLQPNGYSSFCSSAPSERLSFPHPAPGTWRVDVAALANSTENVRGYWSAAYPDGTAGLPAPAAPASITLSAATPASVQGQPDALVATVRDAAGLPLPNVPVTWTATGAGAVVNAEAYTASDGGAWANALSDAPGTQTVTASAGGYSAAVTITWVGVTLPCLSCGTTTTNTPGKASGGGWVGRNGGKAHFGVDAEYNAGAALPGGSLSYDDKAGTAASATVVERFRISGATATWSGPATVNGATGYRYEVTVTDNGEPGRTDTFEIRLTRPVDPTWSYRAGGTLGGGNVRVRAG